MVQEIGLGRVWGVDPKGPDAGNGNDTDNDGTRAHWDRDGPTAASWGGDCH